MGANLLVAAATVLLQSSPAESPSNPAAIFPQPDTLVTEPRSGPAFERLSDLLQYNRVQGLSLGLGYRQSLPVPSRTDLYGTVRYGFSDERVTGRASLILDWQKGRIVLSGYRDILDVDPFSPGRSFSNSLNSLLAGHDDADYALAEGGSGTVEASLGPRLDLGITLRVEQHHSTARAARSAVNDWLGGDGLFPANPPVREGLFAFVVARLSGTQRVRWNVALDLLGGTGQTAARVYGAARRSFGSRPKVTLKLNAGVGTEPALPQTLFRVGGVQTVRGFEYGTLRSAAFWSAQLDFVPVGDRVRPVVFLDAGQGSRLGGLFSSTALVGGGLGISLLHGLIRLDFSRPISPEASGKLRFDIVLGSMR
jgi:hypothetical protein